MHSPPRPLTRGDTDLGPQPATVAAAAAPPSLSRSRRALLAALQSEPGPVTLSALSTTTGLHVNTVREHLAALTDAGLVVRGRATAAGPGRPAATFAAAEPEPGPVSAEYAGLATALASMIHRTSSTPSQDATVAGIEWGRELARTGPGPHPADTDATGARGRVVQLLAHLGFDPQPAPDGTAVLLTRCPLLETARAYPDVVCAVHLGIVRGALGQHGADDTGAELYPFSEPGACRLDLARTDTVAG